MILLDENIPSEQFELLTSRGIRCRQIGRQIADLSIEDENIIKLLHHTKRSTLFTRDKDFFKRELCHSRYCLAWLDIVPEEVAMVVQRFLCHPRFKTAAMRMGVVARVHHDGIRVWTRNSEAAREFRWIELAN